MITIATRMIAAIAALGLVSAPIIAQANTRAGDAGATYSVLKAGVGLGRADEGEGQAQIASIFFIVAATGAVAAGLGFATDVIGDDQSPGT